MNNSIKLENGEFGAKAIIIGHWLDEYLSFFYSNNIQELELNDGKGWNGEDIEFIKKLPFIKSIIIIDFSLKSVEAIHHLNNLVKMEIYTYSKTPVNFNYFPNLEECGFEWIKGSSSLLELKKLKKLYINRYDKKTTDEFSKIKSLKELCLLNSNIIEFEKLSNLIELKYLKLGNLKNLKNLNFLKNLKNLETLELYKCKNLFNINAIFSLNKLKRLLLIDLGNIESIKGIEFLIELNELLFYESTNVIDGDLTPIFMLNNLKNISFMNRKHYTHKLKDFLD